MEALVRDFKNHVAQCNRSERRGHTCPIFPGSEYDVVWANKQLGGSQARREDDSKEGYRPDLVIKREGVTFLIGEVKPPEHDTSLDDYTQDLWKLLIMMKDELDHMLDAGYDHEFMFGLHIFGYKVDLWVLRLEIEGVYQLYHVGEACLPRYQLDTSGVKYVCQLFFSVKVRYNDGWQPMPPSVSVCLSPSLSLFLFYVINLFFLCFH